MPKKIKLQGKYARLANKMLHEVTEILEQENIHYVLEAGTLLGIVRENRLLPWDHDLDVTIPSDYCHHLLKIRWKFWRKGYRTRIRKFARDIGPFKKGMPRILKIQTTKFLFIKDTSLMDIFIKYPVKDEYQWIVSVKKPVLKGTPKHFYDKRTQITYREKKYFVPLDYKGYLTYHYGNWKVPVKEWNFRTDDNCVKKEL